MPYYANVRLRASDGRLTAADSSGRTWEWPIGELGVLEIVWVTERHDPSTVAKAVEVAVAATSVLDSSGGVVTPYAGVTAREYIVLMDLDGQAEAMLATAGWDRQSMSSFAAEAGLGFRERSDRDRRSVPVLVPGAPFIRPPIPPLIGRREWLIIGMMSLGALVFLAILLVIGLSHR